MDELVNEERLRVSWGYKFVLVTCQATDGGRNHVPGGRRDGNIMW